MPCTKQLILVFDTLQLIICIPRQFASRTLAEGIPGTPQIATVFNLFAKASSIDALVCISNQDKKKRCENHERTKIV